MPPPIKGNFKNLDNIPVIAMTAEQRAAWLAKNGLIVGWMLLSVQEFANMEKAIRLMHFERVALKKFLQIIRNDLAGSPLTAPEVIKKIDDILNKPDIFQPAPAAQAKPEEKR